MNAIFQKLLRLRVARLKSKCKEIRIKHEAVINKLPDNPTRDQKRENMTEWIRTNELLRKAEKKLQNAKRLLVNAQDIRKTDNSN